MTITNTIDPRIEGLDPTTVYVDHDGDLWVHDGAQFRYVTDVDAPEYRLSDDDLSPEVFASELLPLGVAASAAIRSGLGL